MGYRATVCGVGVKDVDYTISQTEQINGKSRVVWMCPCYITWGSMIRRCYSSVEQAKTPNYIGCHVHEDWIYFSNFKSWMQDQDYIGKQLDKDLLIPGNKLYSADTCVFVSHRLNCFLVDQKTARGTYPIGVCLTAGKFQSNCHNPFTSKLEYLGLFKTPEEAHLAWKKRKHELACQLADLETDPRIQKALRERFL